jgi:L-glyceraldehyde 3-phosphate reductase
MLNRWIEDELLSVLSDLGVGCIAFSPLAQGMLTDKYLDGVPQDARAGKNTTLDQRFLSEGNLARVRALNKIARARGQSLAQMALAWTIRDPRVTSALVGARTLHQLDDSLDSLKNLAFSPDELTRIDQHATDGGIDLWRASSTAQPQRIVARPEIG